MWAEKALKEALKEADQAEVLEISSSFRRVLVENNKVVYFETSSENSLRVMVVKEKRVGLASVNSLTEERIREAVQTAVAFMKTSRPDPEFCTLISPKPLSAVSEIFDNKIASAEPSEVVDYVLKAVEKAKAGKTVITQGEVYLGVSTLRLVNSEGVDVEYSKTRASFSITLTAYGKSGGSESFRERSTIYWEDLKLEENVGELAELAHKTLSPEKIEPGEYTVLMAPDAVSQIISVIAFAANADNVRKKRSPWAERLNTEVASKQLTVVDDGTLPRGVRTAPCDGEGYPMKKKTVIEKGVLKTYLYDYYTARLMNTESTGNASLSRPFPAIAATNLIIEAGAKSFEDLVSEVKKGVYIPRLPPTFINPITGDFSAELRQAFLIENGELTKPVRWGMVAGNAYALMQSIVEVASDKTQLGSIITPSILFEKVRITG